jgi:hypothetical protein
MTNFLYNPDRKPKNELIGEFVIRTDIYNDIMKDLETSKMENPEQHYLVVGQRGSGKTTLLNRVKYGIDDSEILREKVVPIIFSEEQYNISELVNLWENIAQYLEDYQGFTGLYDEMELLIAKKDFEELSYNLLIRNLRAKNKKLVLLIDNVADMLNKLDKKEIRRLRSILQTDTEIRLIAGSPFHPESFADYREPLFEFFKVIRLEGLTKWETELLLLKLAEMNGEQDKIQRIIKETPDRIDTLRTLTGGVPRTIALMYRIFIEFNHEDSVKDLEKILDAVTPLYKHRMDDLPTYQQKIVDAVAKNWDGMSVKELKSKIRMDSKNISAQLSQLRKNQIIQAVETDTKNNIYFLRERFFNIWYLMRFGRKYDKERVVWLVKFLESWCSMIEIEQRVVDYVVKIKGGQLDEQMVNFYGEVYTGILNMSSETKLLLKESTPHYLSKQITIDDAELYRLAFSEYENKNFVKEFELLRQIQNPDHAISIKVALLLFKLISEDKDSYIKVSNGFTYVARELRGIKGQGSTELSFFMQIEFFILTLFLTISYLPMHKYEEASKVLEKLIHHDEFTFNIHESVINTLVQIIFLQFLNYEQPNTLFESFEKYPVWKDRLRPVYYATLKILNKESEVNKMPPELDESVNKILYEVSEFVKIGRNDKNTGIGKKDTEHSLPRHDFDMSI